MNSNMQFGEEVSTFHDGVCVQRFGDERDRRGCGVTSTACGIALSALQLTHAPEVLIVPLLPPCHRDMTM